MILAGAYQHKPDTAPSMLGRHGEAIEISTPTIPRGYQDTRHQATDLCEQQRLW
jgi:hypothetical protein